MLPISSWTPTYFTENEDFCLNQLKEQSFRREFPFLNNRDQCMKLRDKLVLFRGMVQDIMNPVLYVESFKIRNKDTNSISVRSAKYCDSISLQDNEEILEDSLEEDFHEKRLVHCVPTPGLNAWVSTVNSVQDQSDPVENKKRKCLIDNDVEMEDTSENSVTASMLKNQSNIMPGVLLNIYDQEVNIRLNEVVEVIGFLSTPTDLQVPDDGSNYYNSLMKIHVVSFSPSYSIFHDMSNVFKDNIVNHLSELRDELWVMFTDLLLGDTLAADYLICNLISSIYSRKDALVLGKFTLNISNIPNELNDFKYCSSLYNFFECLVEKSQYLPLSISYLNSASMIPKRKTEENRLMNNFLQLSDRTYLVIDETLMEPGQLFDTGVRNMLALSDIILKQTMNYDFEFYKLPFQTNIPVLTLSVGKSLLPCDARLILDPDESCVLNIREVFARNKHKMSDPLLTKLRAYLIYVSSLEYDITNEMREFIENYMVDISREQSNRTTVDDLHRLMVLSRLMSVSRGYNSLMKDTWEYSVKMEHQRKTRLELVQ